MNIFLPNPCREDFSKMTPNEQGAFCKRCCKAVLDLTSKTTEEIIGIISSAGKVCGRVRKDQLSPARVPVGGNWGRLRAFACALLLVFGSALFTACGQDHKVGEVAYIPDSTLQTPPDTASQVESNVEAPGQSDTVGNVQDTAKNKRAIKEKPPVEMSVQEEKPQRQRPHPLPLEPRWNGGSYEETQKAIKARLKYPEEAKKNNIQGIVWVDFLVKANGETTNFKVRQGLGYGCDEEAIRVLKSLGKWEPGKQAGKPVDMEYSVGVPFEP